MTTEVEMPFADAQPDLAVATQTRRLQIVCWFALIAMAIIRAWFTRYAVEADGLSYLDIARAVATGHPGAAIHAYWSPGYPLLVSFFFWAFHPNAYWEFPLVHLVNLLIFIGVLAGFQLFWRELLQWHRKFTRVRESEIPEATFWALGYAIFGIAILNAITVARVTPDLLVSAFCCLAGWSALRLRRAPSIGHSLLLGCILGLGYYAKAPFFPMAIVFIICACSWWPPSRRTLVSAGTSIVTFLLVCAPFVTALSLAKGRLTFGDSARVNQAFYVNGVQYFRHWQGGPPGSGMPIHPTRKLNDFPEIYEFATRNMGTYPPWSDPTYWYAGITPHLDLKRQTIIFAHNLTFEFRTVMEYGAELVCALIILALIASHQGWLWTKGMWQLWFVWAPGAIALAMFALVHFEPRFLGGWLILLFAGAVCASALPTDTGTRRAVRCIGFAALITVAASLTLQASREAVSLDQLDGRSSREVSIAAFLLNNGLHPGDGVAIIGNGSEANWAHLAQLQVMAEIPASNGTRPGHPALDFWQSGPEVQQKVMGTLERTGARAVIAGSQQTIQSSAPSFVPAPWKKIDGTGAYVYFFPANP